MHEGPGFHARRPLRWRAGAAPPAVEDQLRVLAAVATLETQEAIRSEPGEAPAPAALNGVPARWTSAR